MRPSRVFRLIIRILLMVLTVSMSLVSFLGSYSALLILSNPENIVIPDGDLEINLDATHPDEMNITIPYQFKNVGYFDLEDMKVSIKIYFNYANKSNDNKTVKIEILNKNIKFDTIKAEEKEKDEIFIDSDDFKNLDEITNAIPFIDAAADPQTWYTMDMKLSAYYSMRLLYFYVELEDLDVGEENII